MLIDVRICEIFSNSLPSCCEIYDMELDERPRKLASLMATACGMSVCGLRRHVEIRRARISSRSALPAGQGVQAWSSGARSIVRHRPGPQGEVILSEFVAISRR